MVWCHCWTHVWAEEVVGGGRELFLSWLQEALGRERCEYASSYTDVSREIPLFTSSPMYIRREKSCLSSLGVFGYTPSVI